MTKLPNLFRSEDDVRAARYYYERFLTRLFVVKRYKRMIEACREIRRYARRILSRKKVANLRMPACLPTGLTCRRTTSCMTLILRGVHSELGKRP